MKAHPASSWAAQGLSNSSNERLLCKENWVTNFQMLCSGFLGVGRKEASVK